MVEKIAYICTQMFAYVSFILQGSQALKTCFSFRFLVTAINHQIFKHYSVSTPFLFENSHQLSLSHYAIFLLFTLRTV